MLARRNLVQALSVIEACFAFPTTLARSRYLPPFVRTPPIHRLAFLGHQTGSTVPTATATTTGAPNDTGVGRHFHTQILYAVGYLKEHPNNPIRLEELAAFSRVNELQHNSELLAAFRAHDKVNYDEKLDLYSYKVCVHMRAVFEMVGFQCKANVACTAPTARLSDTKQC